MGGQPICYRPLGTKGDNATMNREQRRKLGVKKDPEKKMEKAQRVLREYNQKGE